jgi:hypothetical protein
VILPPLVFLASAIDKLKLIGQNLGRVFHYRLGRVCIGHAIVHKTKQPNLKLKTRTKQLFVSLPLAFALPASVKRGIDIMKHCLNACIKFGKFEI